MQNFLPKGRKKSLFTLVTKSLPSHNYSLLKISSILSFANVPPRSSNICIRTHDNFKALKSTQYQCFPSLLTSRVEWQSLASLHRSRTWPMVMPAEKGRKVIKGQLSLDCNAKTFILRSAEPSCHSRACVCVCF